MNMNFQTLSEWLKWQETLHPSEIELGLERVRQAANNLSFFQKKIKTITVAGTNGKGSCVAYLESMLLASGYKVGAYASPHLLNYNERVRINGASVDDQTLCNSFERIDTARKNISLTYFEWGTLAALDIFSTQRVDIQILEVGLGGRLDAVNIIDADAAIVINVALDHEAWLGSTREAIGVEKAGIFRKNIPLIVGEADPPASVLQAAKNLETPAVLANLDFNLHESGLHWIFNGKNIEGETVCWEGLPIGKLPLPSAACALQALSALGVLGEKNAAKGIEQAKLAGRFQQITCRGQKVILDVAHNPAGAQYLSEQIRRRAIKLSSVVFSALDDKDIQGVVLSLQQTNCPWYIAPLSVHRAASADKLNACVQGGGVKSQSFSTVADALKHALNYAKLEEPILVCGSFHTVAEALDYLMGGSFNEESL